MGEIEFLYHYTSMMHWEQIQKSGYLKLTPSNLLKPQNPKIIVQEDGIRNVVDETDSYKPVVWLTHDELAQNHAMSKWKEEIQIAIRYDKSKHHWWIDWKDKNRMNKNWFKKLTCHGEKYGSWYVCEEIIPLSEVVFVKNLKTNEIIYKQGEL